MVAAGCLFDGLHERGVVLVHPAVHVIEERIVTPELLGMQEPQGQGLRHPADARAAPAVALTGVLTFLPLRRRRMFVGSPAIVSRPALAGRRVDPRMSGKDDL